MLTSVEYERQKGRGVIEKLCPYSCLRVHCNFGSEGYRWTGIIMVAVSRQGVKEVLRREIQGLKVYPFYRSLVFSMTGTYF
jgi:hypothetical protein